MEFYRFDEHGVVQLGKVDFDTICNFLGRRENMPWLITIGDAGRCLEVHRKMPPFFSHGGDGSFGNGQTRSFLITGAKKEIRKALVKIRKAVFQFHEFSDKDGNKILFLCDSTLH